MRGFLERLQWQLAQWMQGRYGTDGLSNFLLGVGIACIVLSLIPGLDLLSFGAFVFLALSIIRSFSKNIEARTKENEKYESIMAKPKRWAARKNKQWENRKTTHYFKCKGCGTTLSVPRGKGTLRVVCPKCKTETMKKS